MLYILLVVLAIVLIFYFIGKIISGVLGLAGAVINGVLDFILGLFSLLVGRNHWRRQ